MQLPSPLPDGFHARSLLCLRTRMRSPSSSTPAPLPIPACPARTLMSCARTSPADVDLANDSIVVLAPDGAIVADAFVWDSAPHIRPHLTADVHPAYRSRGIGMALCAWGEARAQRAVDKAPEGLRVAVREFILGSDEAARSLLHARGFVLVRHNLRMRIELDAPPPEPQTPAGVTIRSFVPGQDDEGFAVAMQEGFRVSLGLRRDPLGG